MFAEASSRLRTQAGTISPAMSRTLSNLLNLSLNPATDKRELVAATELDPVILAEFLKLESPSNMADWHSTFNRTHFMCVAAGLANQLVSMTEERWASANELGYYALVCSHIAMSLAKTADSVDASDAKLTALLASMGDSSLSYLPLIPRDAIRFQYAPADELKDTDSLIQIIAIANQLAQHPDVAVKENYLSDLGYPDTNAEQLCKDARESVARLLDDLSPGGDYNTEQLNLSEALANFQRKALLDLQLGTTGNFQKEIQRLGVNLFNLNSCLFFQRSGEGFSHEDIFITSEKSIVSKAAATKSIISSSDTSMIVIDQQMLERSNSSKLLAIPVVDGNYVTGILVAGTDSYDPALNSRGLEIFAASVVEATSTSTPSEQVSLDFVRRKAREITHEVNNPFSIIQNYLKILTLKLGEEHDAHKAISTISSEIQRASLILRRYNTIGEEEKESLESANCHDSITNLVEVFKSSYPSITFSVELKSDHPQISLSAEQLNQVLVNLLKNSIEAMDSAGEITIRTTDINFPTLNYLQLEISDNGPGIARDLRNKLFLPGTTNKSDEDSGLGLGIVNDIVSTNHGMISFQTDEAGTCFRILLPQTSTSSNSSQQSS